MKKQIWIKIIVNVFLFVSVVSCILLLILHTRNLIGWIGEIKRFSYDEYIIKSVKINIQEDSINCIFLSINLIADVIIFVFLNFKDASYLTSSLFKKWNDGKAQREVEQKEKKQAKLEAEIAEKQAMLDEMKKE